MVVTGVSQRAGLGFAIARRLLADGARVMLHSFFPPAQEGPEKSDSRRLTDLVDELGGISDRLQRVEADLCEPSASRHVIERTVDAFGAVDALVVNHTHDSKQSLETAAVEELDRAWAVNARAAVLLAQAFAVAHDEKASGWADRAAHLRPTPWADARRAALRAQQGGHTSGHPHARRRTGRSRDNHSAWMTGQVIDAEGGFRRSG